MLWNLRIMIEFYASVLCICEDAMTCICGNGFESWDVCIEVIMIYEFEHGNDMYICRLLWYKYMKPVVICTCRASCDMCM